MEPTHVSSLPEMWLSIRQLYGRLTMKPHRVCAENNAVEEQRKRWERKRNRTAQELLKTERRYVEELELTTKYYDEVFRARCGNLKLAREGICGTIPSIVKINRSLLIALEHNLAGSGFQTFSQYLHLYKTHTDCIEPTRLAVQTQAKKNKSFARFKKLQESRPEFHGQTLEQLLDLPLLRLFKYKHYLLDIVDNSFPGCADTLQLNRAAQDIAEVCEYAENVKQRQENDQQLRRVQKLLKGRRVRIARPAIV
ncbi:rho guanine nucleotide exchange factor 39 isoform X2 [Pseudophryne corroboree]|uniref:rho guanine nucleotide exchange factor 39 isoform X2 n=1 Tax=Pseudophryne corroboree TaxID=495146 RepID=UPI003082106E